MKEEENLLEKALSAFVNNKPNYRCKDLKIALVNESVETIQDILCEQYGVELKYQDSADWTQKCREIVNICIEKEIDVNLTNYRLNYSTLLHFVAKNLYEDFKSVLVRCKFFDIDAIKKSHPSDYHTIHTQTLLHFAVENGRTNVVKTLLEFGADVNVGPKYYKDPPIFLAVSTLQLEIVEMLLQAGANVNLRDGIINCAFGKKESDNSFNYGKKLPTWEVINLLCEYKANLNFQNHQGTLSLFRACRLGRFDEVKFLVKHGAVFVSPGDNFKYTVLHWAVRGNNFELVNYLLQNGADIEAADLNNETAIFTLTKIGQSDSWKIKNEEKGIREFVPDLPIEELEHHVHKIKKATDMIEFLVDCGADVNVFNIFGETPLNHCVLLNSLEIVECLLELKVDIKAESNNFPLFNYQNHFSHLYSDRLDTCVLLTAFLATKDEDIDFSCFHNNSAHFKWVEPYFQLCKAEVNQMKSRTICHNRSVTFFDFLTKDLMKVLQFCRSEEIMTVLESGRHKEEFPLYKFLFEKRMQRVQKLKNYYDAFLKFLKKYFKKSLPLVVIDEILSYLTSGDLRNFGRALHVSKEFPDGIY